MMCSASVFVFIHLEYPHETVIYYYEQRNNTLEFIKCFIWTLRNLYDTFRQLEKKFFTVYTYFCVF